MAVVTGFVYLAHSIDLVGAGASDAYHESLRACADAGRITYDPAQAWTFYGPGSRDVATDLLAANRAVLARAECVLVTMDGPSFGVPVEIEWACDMGVRVLVYKVHRAASSVYLMSRGVQVVDDYQRLVEALS